MRQIELVISKKFAKIRKEFAGTGAIDVQSRLCGDTIFVKYKVTYTPLEKVILNDTYDQGYVDIERKSSEGLREYINEHLVVDSFLGDAQVVKVYSKFDTESNVAYWIIHFNTNIEKYLRDDFKNTNSSN